MSLEQAVEKLKGNASARKGWLLLAAAADCLEDFYEDCPWTVPVASWRRLFLAQAEGRTSSGERERLVGLVNEIKDSSVANQDFESALCWRYVSRALSGDGPESLLVGHAIARGMFRFVEYALPPADLLALIAELFTDHLEEVRLDPAWLAWQQGTARAIAQRIYDGDDFRDLPILADALEDAGCDEPLVLDHCRTARRHVRGCWVVDWCLDKA